jgi:hypothetical protein
VCARVNSPSQWELGAATDTQQMQVATLFRESTSLLGATMEAGGGGGGAPDSTAPGVGPGALSYDTYSHPVSLSNKYKL